MAAVPAEVLVNARPRYEPPTVRVMSEVEILNTFQITQAMAGWWVGAASPTCNPGC